MKNTNHALVIATFGIASVAMAQFPPPDPTDCNYSIAEFGGTSCNVLPPPPPLAPKIGECIYYFCDSGDSCGMGQWTKKQRKRYIFEAGADPVQYFSIVASPDVDQGCCYCN